MRLVDRYAFSLHTIKENKSRSILTIIISTFLSLLIMGLMCIAISFSKNGSAILNETFFSKNSIVQTKYVNVYNPKANQKTFNKDYYETFINTVNEHQEVVSYIRYQTNADDSFIYTDPHYPMSYGYEIIEGRGIQPSATHNEIIVSQTKYAQSLLWGDSYGIGTTHELELYYSRETPGGAHISRTFKTSCVVVGIYAPTNEKFILDGEKTTLVNKYSYYIADVNMVLQADPNVYIPSAYISYKNSSDKLKPNSVFSGISSLQDDLNKNMPQAVEVLPLSEGEFLIDYIDATKCEPYETVKMLNNYKLIFIGGGAGIAIVLLLISVGSLANSVMISIDRSKKFIGLLKALGIRARALKNIIIFESMTLISIGVILAYGILWAISYPLNMINDALVSSMYGNFAEAIEFSASFYAPIYILFGAIVLFVLLTIFFARSSLRTISKMDPIEVISEVS